MFNNEEFDFSKYYKYKQSDDHTDSVEEYEFQKYIDCENIDDVNEKETYDEKSPKNVTSKDAKITKIKDFLSFMAPIFLALVLALFLRNFVFINAEIPTGSMENTIPAGSKVIASRLDYAGKKAPERYDIVIFKFPDDEKQKYAKRVIGLPGEKVEIIDGLVYINDKAVPLKDDFVTTAKPQGDFGPYYIPDGCYFMLGDNRTNSKDSRYWINKYVEEDKILGKVKFLYSPKFEKIK